MKIAVPDMISNSYFPAVAAVEFGAFADEGLDMTHELIFPVDDCYKALRDGKVDFVGGSAHAVLSGFPEWQGAKLVAALAQGMYWFLIMRADLNAERGDLDVVKGKRIGAAPWVDYGIRRLLAEAGIDVEKDEVNIAPVPGTVQPGVSFGVTAARALEDGKLDGFWANGMGAEIAVSRGIGTMVIDVRRGDGPAPCFNYTQPALVASDEMIERDPDSVAAAIRAIEKTHAILKRDVSRATEVGRKLFSPDEAALIAAVVERDLPYYDTRITREFVAGMNKFSREMGLLEADVPYEQVVATQFGRGET